MAASYRLLILVVAGLAVALATTRRADAYTREEMLVDTATATLNEIMMIPNASIPATMLRDAQGVAIVPGMIKAGFLIGGRFGRGVVSCRDASGGWSNPIFVDFAGGSFGWQIGVQATDVVLVFRSKHSLDVFLSGSKLTLGADAAVAAGPVGRQAEAAAGIGRTGAAEIYSYSRSRGLFVGVSLEGSVISVDSSADAYYYNALGIAPINILTGQPPIVAPPSAITLRQTLARYSSLAPAQVAYVYPPYAPQTLSPPAGSFAPAPQGQVPTAGTVVAQPQPGATYVPQVVPLLPGPAPLQATPAPAQAAPAQPALPGPSNTP